MIGESFRFNSWRLSSSLNFLRVALAGTKYRPLLSTASAIGHFTGIAPAEYLPGQAATNSSAEAGKCLRAGRVKFSLRRSLTSSLKASLYFFASLKLVGKNSGVVYQIAGEVKILVANVDIDQRKIDFSLA